MGPVLASAALLTACSALGFGPVPVNSTPSSGPTALQFKPGTPEPTASPSASASVEPSSTVSPGASPTPTLVPGSAIASTSIITTLIGRGAMPYGVTDLGDGGSGTNAYLAYPNDVVAAPDGTVFVADRNNDRIRALSNGTVSTFAGGGTIVATDSAIAAASASFKPSGTGPSSMALTPDGDLIVVGGNAPGKKVLYAVPRSAGNRYGKIFEPGMVSVLLAGAATPSPQPAAVAAGPDGTLYLADGTNSKVWAMNSAGVVSEFAGNGTQAATESIADEGAMPQTVGFGGIAWVSVDPSGNVYIAETNKVQRIRMVCQVAGTYFGQTMVAGRIYSIVGRGAMTLLNSIDVGDFGQPSNPTGEALKATLNGMRSAAFDARGNMFFVDSGNHRVRRVDRQSGIITTVVGTGAKSLSDGSNLGDDWKAGLATLNSPTGLVFDRDGNLLIGDTGSNRVRVIKP